MPKRSKPFFVRWPSARNLKMGLGVSPDSFSLFTFLATIHNWSRLLKLGHMKS